MLTKKEKGRIEGKLDKIKEFSNIKSIPVQIYEYHDLNELIKLMEKINNSKAVLKHMEDREQQKINIDKHSSERNQGREQNEVKEILWNWSMYEQGTPELEPVLTRCLQGLPIVQSP